MTLYSVYVGIFAGVNVKTGEVFPSSFTHKGPGEELRSARTFTGEQVIYNNKFELETNSTPVTQSQQIIIISIIIFYDSLYNHIFF